MVQDLRAFLRSPLFYRPRAMARTWVHKHVERPVVTAHNVGRSMDQGADLLYFGDSSLLHVAAFDPDSRRMGELLEAELGLRTAQFYGPGYSPELFAQVVRLLQDRPRPKAVVVSFGLRTSTHTHVIEHPFYAYRRAVSVLTSAERLSPAILRHAYKRLPSDADYDQFRALPHRSAWPMAATIGEYRSLLKGYAEDKAPRELQQTLFAYFHGEYSAGSRGLANWTELGRQLEALGVPVVAHRCYMPVELGSALLGPEFREHIDANFSAIEASFRAGFAGPLEVVDRPLPNEVFINPYDGTEHLRLEGRRMVVEAVAPVVARSLR